MMKPSSDYRCGCPRATSRAPTYIMTLEHDNDRCDETLWKCLECGKEYTVTILERV